MLKGVGHWIGAKKLTEVKDGGSPGEARRGGARRVDAGVCDGEREIWNHAK